MPAIWTQPITWEVDQLVTEGQLNEQVRDNLEWLKNPPRAAAALAANIATTSTAFVDAPGLALTLTTAGGALLVGFTGVAGNAAGTTVVFDLVVDGVSQGGLDGVIGSSAGIVPMSFVWLVEGLAAGAHTVKLQWKVSAGTGTLYGGGTAYLRFKPQLWAREV
ncbi:MAG: hypothetical protein ACUVSX_14670 [Aggregatilineales bacterium]